MPESVLLSKTASVRLGLSRCGEVASGSSEEEIEPEFTVVFPIRGVFVYRAPGRRVTATPAVALFLNRGDEHLVSHPAGGYDQSVFISIATDTVTPFLSTAGSTFPRSHVTTDLSVYVAVREIARRASDPRVDALAIDEFAINTIGQLLHGQEAPTPPDRHQNLVADTEEYLAAHFREDCGLQTISRQVATSPHHLSRLFHRLTGSTVSARRTQLRLRHALHLLEEGASDISTVAVDAGFYDHSHLAKNMRAHLDVAPSQLRDAVVRSLWPGANP